MQIAVFVVEQQTFAATFLLPAAHKYLKYSESIRQPVESECFSRKIARRASTCVLVLKHPWTK